jgi:hypothetical protein
MGGLEVTGDELHYILARLAIAQWSCPTKTAKNQLRGKNFGLHFLELI